MPVDYEEVLRDLDAREVTLLSELNAVRSAKPAIHILMRAQETEVSRSAPKGKYVGWGATKAIQDLILDEELLTREEIYSRLRSEGWTTESKDPLSTVSATLSQLKDSVLEKVEDRWRKRKIHTIASGKFYGGSIADDSPNRPLIPSEY